MKNKGGRPRVSKLGIDTSNRKEYDKRYRQACRYIFTVNLSQEKDSDIIEALENTCVEITNDLNECKINRQKALKELIRLGIQKQYELQLNNTEV